MDFDIKKMAKDIGKYLETKCGWVVDVDKNYKNARCRKCSLSFDPCEAKYCNQCGNKLILLQEEDIIDSCLEIEEALMYAFEQEKRRREKK